MLQYQLHFLTSKNAMYRYHHQGLRRMEWNFTSKMQTHTAVLSRKCMLIYQSILRDEVNYEYCLFVGPVSIYSVVCCFAFNPHWYDAYLLCLDDTSYDWRGLSQSLQVMDSSGILYLPSLLLDFWCLGRVCVIFNS